MGKRLTIKQITDGVDADFMIRNMDVENDEELFKVGVSTPSMLPGSAGQALKVSCHARYWVLDSETHIVGQNGRIVQIGYAGDYLVEEGSGTIKIYRRDDFAQFFITQAGKSPTIHREVVGESVGMGEGDA